jgi:hypothetical protein
MIITDLPDYRNPNPPVFLSDKFVNPKGFIQNICVDTKPVFLPAKARFVTQESLGFYRMGSRVINANYFNVFIFRARFPDMLQKVNPLVRLVF